ncbi:MAG: FlgD immunoglobulin-like domain containing protein [Fibrobacterota bacterium]
MNLKHMLIFLLVMTVLAWSGSNTHVTQSNAWQFAVFFNALQAGDTLTIDPGHYPSLSSVNTRADGTADHRIVLRAAQKNTVFIANGSVEWAVVTNSYWTFENLDFFDTLGGIHNFHIKPGGNYIIIRNCHFSSLQEAPVKMSSGGTSSGPYSDYLIFENNESERVEGPFDSENLNGANLNGGWYHVIRGNYFHDISKTDASQWWNFNGAYGAFVKAGSRYCIMENNLVKNINGFGLSFGGGLTGQQYFNARSPYPIETKDCIMRNNVIVGPPGRDGGNRAIKIVYANDNYIYNNTVINAQPITVAGNNSLGVWTGVGNVLKNNLTVNMFYADSLWDVITGGIYSSTPGLAVDGIMFIFSGKYPFESIFDNQVYTQNTCTHNFRLDVADLHDIFWDPDSDDYRLKPTASHIMGHGAYLDTMAPYDFLGNPRPNPPSYGAYEGYDAIDNYVTPIANGASRELRQRTHLKVMAAKVSPNPSTFSANIAYDVLNDMDPVEITLWDVRGHMVYNMYHGAHSTGHFSRTWNCCDHEGKPVAAGTYLVRFRSKMDQFHTKFSVVR